MLTLMFRAQGWLLVTSSLTPPFQAEEGVSRAPGTRCARFPAALEPLRSGAFSNAHYVFTFGVNVHSVTSRGCSVSLCVFIGWGLLRY